MIIQGENMDNRKNWTKNQDLLRKTLASRSRFDEAVQVFLDQHSAVHSAAISGEKGWSLHDEVITGLDEEIIRKVPKVGENSIAWLLWHITRIEDMTINTLTMSQDQVLNAEWAKKLEYSSPDCGAGMDDVDVANLSKNINIKALLEYRAAVGQRTRESVLRLNSEKVREIVPETIVQKLVGDGSINDRADWLHQFYLGRSRGFFLTRTATSHNFIHLNEAGRTAKKLKKV